jgi:hypothetical protein
VSEGTDMGRSTTSIMRSALRAITEMGAVCENFTECDHQACRDSSAACMTALEALDAAASEEIRVTMPDSPEKDALYELMTAELARLEEERDRYRETLCAIADAEVPGVSGGPQGPSWQLVEFVNRALRRSPLLKQDNV